jgi:acyl-CoA thioesterase FadM
MLKLKMETISTKDCVSVILAETSCKYFLPIHFPDRYVMSIGIILMLRVRVETRTIKLGKTSWILESDVYTESTKDVKAATGTARLVFYVYSS